jgi:hypothetical protein
MPVKDAREDADSDLVFLLFAATGGGDVPPSLWSTLRLGFFDGGLLDGFLVALSLLEDADEEVFLAATIFGAPPLFMPFATRGLEESDISADN